MDVSPLGCNIDDSDTFVELHKDVLKIVWR